VNAQEQWAIISRLKLKKADITNPHIVILCQEINKQDKIISVLNQENKQLAEKLGVEQKNNLQPSPKLKEGEYLVGTDPYNLITDKEA